MAALGADVWNRWIATKASSRLAPYLAGVVPYSAAELSQLSATLRLKSLPDLHHGVSFSGHDFSRDGHRVSFDGFVFPESTNFSETKLAFQATFTSAVFGGNASFAAANLGLNFTITASTILGIADFRGALSEGAAIFNYTTFNGYCDFEGAYFGHATFFQSTFQGSANFGGATFAEADFDKATFFQSCNFRAWERPKHTAFIEGLGSSTSAAHSHEWRSEMSRKCMPNELGRISFGSTRFKRLAHFGGRTLRGPVSFRHAQFEQVPEFEGVQGSSFLDPTGMDVSFVGKGWQPFRDSVSRIANFVRKKWKAAPGTPAVASLIGALGTAVSAHLYRPPGELEQAGRKGWTTSGEIAARIRRLRKIMADIHAHDTERDLFILERKAERGILWSLRGWRNRTKALSWTAILLLYGITSDYGRSVARPVLALFATAAIFQALYRWLQDLQSYWNPDLISFTLGNMFPFASGLNPARKDMLARLFPHLDPVFDGTIKIPIMIELASLAQSIFGGCFLFLLLLAIRNRFKIG